MYKSIFLILDKEKIEIHTYYIPYNFYLVLPLAQNGSINGSIQVIPTRGPPQGVSQRRPKKGTNGHPNLV